MVFAILCLLLSHLIIIHIPFISSPGENDVPMAEGFFLFFYVTYCIQVCALPHSPQMPMTSPLPFKNLDYGFRLSHLLDLIKSDALNTYVYPWLRWFITMFTWFSTPWIIRLVFRTFVFSATTHMLASHARVYPPQHSFLKFSFSYLQVLYKPFLMMYYAHTLLLLFNWVTDLTYATQWLSLVTSIFFYACFLCI
ncbi:hypothetical protein HMI56_006228 [Coelomomyces lativittatus]|nr:hypothetical protein HMI56_006228 [Coelomomyces lativittatus]